MAVPPGNLWNTTSHDVTTAPSRYLPIHNSLPAIILLFKIT